MSHAALGIFASARVAPSVSVPPTPHISLGSPIRVSTSSNMQGTPALAVASNGNLVAAWRKASMHGVDTTGEILASISTDTGATWSTPVQIIKITSEDSRDPAMIRLADGRLMLQFFRGNGLEVMVSYSSNNGVTWTTPAGIPFAAATTLGCSGPPVQLANGDIIVVAYGGSTANWSVWMMRSTDNGATWGSQATLANGTTDSRAYSEPNIGLLPNGDLMVLIRCDTTGSVYRRYSSDGGSTWTTLTSVYTGGGGRPTWFSFGTDSVVTLNRNGTTSTQPRWMLSRANGGTWTGEWHNISPVGSSTSVYAQAARISPTLVGFVHAVEGGANAGVHFVAVDLIPGSSNITWADIFDRQAAWPVTNFNLTGTASLTTSTRTGTGKAVNSNAGAQAIARKSMLVNTTSRGAGFDFKIAVLPGTASAIFGFGRSDGAGDGGATCYLFITPTGQIEARSRVTSTIYGASAAGVIVAGQHHRIRFYVATGTAPAGAVTVYVDDVQVLTVSGITVNATTGTGLGTIWLYSHAGDVTFDHVIMSNDGSIITA